MIICSKCDKIVIVCHKIMQNTMRQQRKQNYHVFMKTWFWGRNGGQNRKFSVFWWFIPTVVRAITRFEKIVISISRCCGPQKNEKILTNHKKMKKVNTKCDFRQFRLDSKSYNFVFCVFFVFLTDRKCRPLSSFSKSGGFGWVRNVIYERQNLTEVFGFWFQLWSRSGSLNCTRIGASPLSFCHMILIIEIDEIIG